jgi:hypothetical protein
MIVAATNFTKASQIKAPPNNNINNSNYATANSATTIIQQKESHIRKPSKLFVAAPDKAILNKSCIHNNSGNLKK